MTGIPIIIPYNFDLNMFADIPITESMYIYFLPFWYDYPLNEKDGKVFNICSREEYGAYINEKVKENFPINYVLFLNQDNLMEDEVLLNYYINFLGITKFIIKNDMQYNQIKKYLETADIFYFDKDFVYNINEVNWDKCFFPKEISSSSSSKEISSYLKTLNLQPIQDWRVNMKKIRALIDATFGNNDWEEYAQNIYDEAIKPVSIFSGGAITSCKKIVVPWVEDKNDYYCVRSFNVGFIKNIPLFISENCGIDIEIFKNEYIDIVKRFNIHPKIFIDKNCSLILPFDKEIDKMFQTDECDFCEGIKSWKLRHLQYQDFDIKIQDFLENLDKYNTLLTEWKEKIKELYNQNLEISDSFYAFEENFNFLISVSEIMTFETFYEQFDYETFVFEPVCGLYKNEQAGIQNIEKILQKYNDYEELKAYYFIKNNNEDFDIIKQNCEKDFAMKTLNWEKNYIITENDEKLQQQNNNFIENQDLAQTNLNGDYVEFIIPYYNTTEAIRNCIAQNIRYLLTNSLIKPHFILVCNGSDDEDKVKELTKEWSDYILYLNTIEQSGADGARNMGIDHATGRRLVFWDADDLIIDKHLADELYKLDSSVELIYLKLFLKLFEIQKFENTGNNQDDKMIRVCVNKNLIDKYGWRYPKVYKEEDTGFYRLLDAGAKENFKEINTYVGVYNYAINVQDDCNLCASGPQNYGIENAILTILIAQKLIINKGFELNNNNLIKYGFEQIINDYDFWTKKQENKNSLLFSYTLNILCQMYGMNKIIDEEIDEKEIQKLFENMIEDNHRNQKTIDLYKKEFNIQW